MAELFSSLRLRRVLFLATVDAAVWVFAFASFTAARYTLTGISAVDAVEVVSWGSVFVTGLLAGALHTTLARVVRLHHGRSAVGSAEELLSLSLVTAAVGTLLTVGNVLVGRYVPGTVPFVATCIALVLMAWYRGAYRALDDRPLRRAADAGTDAATRVVVIGAGEAGRQLVRSMLRDPAGKWLPVAIVDDNPALKYRRILGVPVIGTSRQLALAADSYGATVCIIAIPSASSAVVRVLNKRAQSAGFEVKVLPGADQLLSPGRPAIEDVRDINMTDLLGRHQIDTDIASIASYLTGRRVLVTGAGGSIGSELCRQIAQYSPAELIMLDRDESALHAVQLSIYGKAMLDSDDVVLGDIRDSLFIETLFAERKPEVVFHAAALKHLPMLEQYPGEAIKTNVWGTLSILEAARASGVAKFVNISTDKAANPCSVLGFSKRLAEGLTSAIAPTADGTYLSVRFGNVLGSRGSVLTAFTAQIAAGGPVTVTDPEVTRYFMTVQEAVQLVIQAAAIGRDGEALVLDMGSPVSIDCVAKQLIELSGEDIEVVYTGLRQGEKMHEELWGDGEPDLRPAHSSISHTPVPRFDPLQARELDPWCDKAVVIASLEKSVVEMSIKVQSMPHPRAPRVGVRQPVGAGRHNG